MQITIDTNNLTELDLSVLALLTGAPAQAEKSPSAAKAAPKAEAKAKPAPKAEEPAEAVEEVVEDDAPDADGATMEDAVALATKLVSSGQAAKVKAALAEAGAKRVSELGEDKIADFIASLS